MDEQDWDAFVELLKRVDLEDTSRIITELGEREGLDVLLDLANELENFDAD